MPTHLGQRSKHPPLYLLDFSPASECDAQDTYVFHWRTEDVSEARVSVGRGTTGADENKSTYEQRHDITGPHLQARWHVSKVQEIERHPQQPVGLDDREEIVLELLWQTGERRGK